MTDIHCVSCQESYTLEGHNVFSLVCCHGESVFALTTGEIQCGDCGATAANLHDLELQAILVTI